jgi:hypothetical protein
VRIKNLLVRAAVTGVLTATAGVGSAITASPASARPKRTRAYVEQLQQDSEFWSDSALMWAHWADVDGSNHDFDAYTIDVHNELVAKAQERAASADLVACL